MPDQPTLGEVSRTMSQLRDDVRTDFAEIRKDIGSLDEKVATRETINGLERAWHLRLTALEGQVHSWREAAAEAEQRMSKRLDRIERGAWIVALLVIGPVIAALVGLVLVNGNGGVQ